MLSTKLSQDKSSPTGFPTFLGQDLPSRQLSSAQMSFGHFHHGGLYFLLKTIVYFCASYIFQSCFSVLMGLSLILDLLSLQNRNNVNMIASTFLLSLGRLPGETQFYRVCCSFTTNGNFHLGYRAHLW